MINSNKINAKDSITLGVFSTISFVLMLCAGIANLSPYTYLFYPVLNALVNGVVYLYIVTKVPKKGAVLLFCIIPVIYLAVTGVQGMVTALSIVIFAIAAELILGTKRSDMTRITISYLLLCNWLSIGGQFRMFIFPESYFNEALGSGLDSAYVDTLRQLANWKWWLASIVTTIIAAYAGILLGKSIVKKHLVKAGVV